MERTELQAKIRDAYNSKRWGCINSGIQRLDENRTFEQGKITLLGARPGMLTKKLIEQLILRIAIQDKNPIIHFSFETSSEEIIDHILWCLTLDTIFLKSNSTTVKSRKIDKAFKLIQKAPFWVESRDEYKNLDNLISHLKNTLKTNDIKLVIIDYLQLCASLEFANNQTMSIGTKRSAELKKLKALAQELNIHIIVTSALSNYIDLRPHHDKRPEINDFNIENPFDCTDNIILSYRPEFYGFKHWDIYGSRWEKHSTHRCLELTLYQKKSMSCRSLLEFNSSYTEFKNI